MSEWRKTEKQDLDLSDEYGELFLNVYLGSDDSGNIYTQIKWSDIEEKMEDYANKRDK